MRNPGKPVCAAVLAGAIVVAAAPCVAQAQEGAFLFDVLRRPAYKASWERLLKDVQPTPDWLTQFSRNFDGVAGAVKPIDVDGKAYQFSFVCKPGDCAGRKFEVMFEPDAKRAYGALVINGSPPAFYGDPPPPLQDALVKAMKG